MKQELLEMGLLDTNESDAESEPEQNLMDDIIIQRQLLAEQVKDLETQMKTMDRMIKKRKA